MLIVTWIGTAAAIASTVSFTPQAWKIIKTAETKDISAGMYLITVTAFALWTAYGVILDQWPLVASNAICFFLAGFILLMKILPRSQKQRVSRSIDKRLP
jgi:MtN3 and saliva related transmembrane protein